MSWPWKGNESLLTVHIRSLFSPWEPISNIQPENTHWRLSMQERYSSHKRTTKAQPSLRTCTFTNKIYGKLFLSSSKVYAHRIHQSVKLCFDVFCLIFNTNLVSLVKNSMCPKLLNLAKQHDIKSPSCKIFTTLIFNLTSKWLSPFWPQYCCTWHQQRLYLVYSKPCVCC